MRSFKRIFLILFSVSVGCTTQPKAPEKKTEPVAPELLKAISFEEIREALDMDSTELGLHEKAFNSCALPKELRTTPNCETKYFSVVNFQVMCRNSTGTTENTVTSSDLRPLVGNLEWVIGAYRGKATTDGQGRATALVLSERSVSKRRFVVKVQKNALGLTLEDVSKIVVPDNWCR